MYFCCEGRSVLRRTERAFCVSINFYNPARSWHFELEVCIMRYRIESGECGSSEQCVITTAEGHDMKINSSLRKLSGDAKTTSSVIEPVQLASTPGITPLKVVLVGLVLEGSMPILRIVS